MIEKCEKISILMEKNKNKKSYSITHIFKSHGWKAFVNWQVLFSFQTEGVLVSNERFQQGTKTLGTSPGS
jgi:hypothetical protein